MAEKIGERTVITKGCLVSEGDDPLSISEAGLSVKLFFQDRENAEQQGIEWKSVENALHVTLTNWSNPLGTGVQSRIGEQNGVPVIMALYVHAILAPSKIKIRLVNYTFSVGELTP